MNVAALKKRIFCFSIFFLIAFILILFNVYIDEKNLFSSGSDGMTQYIIAFEYIGRFLREIVNNFFTGKLVVPQYDIYIGEGNDILNTFCYYGIGDPLEFLSVFFRGDNIYLGYNLVTILRLYLVGISFIIYATYTYADKEYNTIVIISAIIYTFNMWTIGGAILCHQWLLNALIYLPLLIMGVDKIFNGETITLYVAILFITIISNFYILYMIAVFTFFYVCIKLLNTHNIKSFLRVVLGTITSFMLSAFLFLPTINFILSDNRISALSVPSHLFMPLNQVIDNLVAMFFPINWLSAMRIRFGLPLFLFPFLLAIFLKSSIKEKFITIFFILLFFTPVFWKFMNCMSYESDRWSFIIVFIVSAMLMKGWKIYKYCSANVKLVLILISIILYVIIRKLYLGIYSEHHYLIVVNDIIHIMIVMVLLINIWKQNKADSSIFVLDKCILFAVIFVTIFNLRYISYCDSYGAWDSGLATSDTIAGANNNVYSSAKKILNNEKFNRISGVSLDFDRNKNILLGIPSTQYYWTLVNNSITRYRKQFGFVDIAGSVATDYNNWTIPTTLASVDYIFDYSDFPHLPYNYSSEKNFADNYVYYKNNSPLDLVYYYDRYIYEKELENENVSTKQINMLNSAILSDGIEIDVKKAELKNTKNEDFVLSNGKDTKVNIDENKIVVEEDNGYVLLSFKRKEKSEAFLEFKNIHLYDDLGQEFYDSNFTDKRSYISIFKSNHITGFPYYSIYTRERRHDFTLRLGYEETANDNDIYMICFGLKGTYTFDDLVLSSVDLSGYSESIEKLKTIKVNNFNYIDNIFIFDISSDKDGLACISIPYSKGFKAYVNGDETFIYNVNYKNMAVKIDKGDSIIELKYERPYRKIGYLFSLFGIIAFTILKKFIKIN